MLQSIFTGIIRRRSDRISRTTRLHDKIRTWVPTKETIPGAVETAGGKFKIFNQTSASTSFKLLLNRPRWRITGDEVQGRQARMQGGGYPPPPPKKKKIF